MDFDGSFYTTKPASEQVRQRDVLPNSSSARPKRQIHHLLYVWSNAYVPRNTTKGLKVLPIHGRAQRRMLLDTIIETRNFKNRFQTNRPFHQLYGARPANDDLSSAKAIAPGRSPPRTA